MMDREIQVTLPLDQEGMLGRQCPADTCGRYFKVNPESGGSVEVEACPYCEAPADSQEFATPEQEQYALDVVEAQVNDWAFAGLRRSAERFNRAQRGGPIELRIDVKGGRPIPRPYSERLLETRVCCDTCTLEFAVYGVFASCPACQRLNALTTCLASLEVARKRVQHCDDPDIDNALRGQFPRDALRDTVAAFDSYGKALRAKYPDRLRPKAKTNLFQDLDALDAELQRAGLPAINTILSPDEAARLNWFFQARHVYEHNAGVVDDRFIARIPGSASLRGRLLPLPESDLLSGIDAAARLTQAIDRSFPTGTA